MKTRTNSPRFLAVVREESTAMSERVQQLAQTASKNLKTRWPMEDMLAADMVAVVLDGVENKSWTGFECGYARARGKYIYGITGTSEDEDQRHMDRFAAMCDEVIRFSASDDMAASLGQVSQTLAARILLHTT